MAFKMVVALLIVLPLGAMAGSCAAGYKFKATLGNATCSTNTASQATCMNCCEADVTLCGGNTVTCAAGNYQDSTKAAIAFGADNGLTNCCTAKATCAAYTCPAGMKPDTSAAATKCSGNAASCASNNPSCCSLDTTKCGGNMVTCGAGKYKDSTKAGIAYVNATKVADCCSAKATCADKVTSCGTSMMMDTTKATDECSGSATSCGTACCKLDMAKCGGNSATITCDTGTSLSYTMTGTTKAVCCVTTPSPAACTAFQSSAGSTSGPSTSSGAQKSQILAMNVIFAVSLMAALWK